MNGDDETRPPTSLKIIVADEGEWNDPASLRALRDILSAAQRAYDPDFDPDAPVDTFDPGRSVKWASLIDENGACDEAALQSIGDHLASNIVYAIHAAFVMELRADRLTKIIEELYKDRDRLTRVLATLGTRAPD